MSNVALYSADNKTIYSSIFDVPPGFAAVLFATDLEAQRVRTSAEEVAAEQTFCIRRVIHGFTNAVKEKCLRCDCVYDTGKLPDPVMLVDQIVSTCNGVWQLSVCNNIGIIGVPGTYRLELNDTTAIGTANVYFTLYPLHKVALINGLYFS